MMTVSLKELFSDDQAARPQMLPDARFTAIKQDAALDSDAACHALPLLSPAARVVRSEPFAASNRSQLANHQR